MWTDPALTGTNIRVSVNRRQEFVATLWFWETKKITSRHNMSMNEVFNKFYPSLIKFNLLFLQVKLQNPTLKLQSFTMTLTLGFYDVLWLGYDRTFYNKTTGSSPSATNEQRPKTASTKTSFLNTWELSGNRTLWLNKPKCKKKEGGGALCGARKYSLHLTLFSHQ